MPNWTQPIVLVYGGELGLASGWPASFSSAKKGRTATATPSLGKSGYLQDQKQPLQGLTKRDAP